VTIRFPIGHFGISCWWFEQIESLSPAVYEIYWALGWGHECDLSGSHDVIGHVTIRLVIGHFLFVVLWIEPSLYLSNAFRDIQGRM